MEEEERGSKRNQPYRMMDINELDDQHMATITRKSVQGINLNDGGDGIVFESRANKKRHSSSSGSREGRNIGSIQ